MTTALTDKPIMTVVKWNRKQIDLIKRTVAKGASDDELALFFYICKRSGLDPLLKQIYAYQNWDSELAGYKMVVVTSIDGVRLAGHRTQRVAGVPAASSEVDPNESWHPAEARAIVRMYSPSGTGEIIEFEGKARWKEFARKKGTGEYMRQWSENGMPFHMLEKCAEMQAWRKAAPQETAGLLIREEIAIDIDYDTVDAGADKPTDEQKSLAEGKMLEGKLLEYAAPSTTTDRGGKARNRPGHVLIESGGKNWKLTFFHRPACFADDAAAAAAKGKTVQFDYETKGEYVNLKHLAVKPNGVEPAGMESSASNQTAAQPETPSSAPVGAPTDEEMAENEYKEMLAEVTDPLKVQAICDDAIAKDKRLGTGAKFRLRALAAVRKKDFEAPATGKLL